MKKNIAIALALIGWFAVIAQYVLMIENRVTSTTEATIRFFSFFTILTNTLVAIYFTYLALGKNSKLLSKPGSLTAITVYILVVGLVYQFVLRAIWEPTGLQKIVDELLHSVVPVTTLIFWYLYEEKSKIELKNIINWLVYPLVYLVFVLLRGSISDFYPYPFVNVLEIGMPQVLTNSVILLLVFIVLSAAFVLIGKRLPAK
ncbi:Pr6Pr family membrane protein [uncultured Arcticibacterium sp.]|uniref:Pr6Pr family membrane protein n=1 Tax=uncultured Arcticibacterium sp. TaxID=2173042 RepID=UPI0030F7376B